MQKRLIGFVTIAGALIGAATLAADERPSDRSGSRETPAERAILLTSGTAPLAEVGSFEAPPPAPGIEGAVPPGPMSQSLPPSVQPVPDGIGGGRGSANRYGPGARALPASQVSRQASYRSVCRGNGRRRP